MRAREFLIEMNPASERFQGLDHADKWLAKYTYDNLNKWPDQSVIDTLLRRYPITEPRTIYRGMNFAEKDKFDEFMASIADGTLEVGGVMSWGDDPDKVEQFAVTRPSYYLDPDTMKEYSKASREKEYIAGYRGVILKMVVQPGQAIDVNASGLGHESEILVVSGVYDVEVHRVLKRYRDVIDDGDIAIDDPIVNPRGAGPYDQGLKGYVLHHHHDRLGDASRRALFAEKRKQTEVSPTHVDLFVQHPRSLDEKGTPTYGELHANYFYFAAAERGEFLPEDEAKCRKEAAVVVRKAMRFIAQNPDYVFRYTHEMRAIAMYAGMVEDYDAVMKKHVGGQYRKLQAYGEQFNSREWKSSSEASATFRHHGKRVAEILSQIR